jgi:succinate-semialdehyde dehydrogenase/glutarate-semialdehyde dehydrogenase
MAAGCTVVCKTPGETPFTSLALAELAHRAGIPKGVINIITALSNTAEVGQVLTSHPAIKKVSFTGSTRVGKILMQQSSSSLKKLSMELGGNAPLIVFDDSSLEDAVAAAITAKFRCSGQTCVCANRIFVKKGIYEVFANKFSEKARAFKVGYGFDEGVTHGPLIHSRAIDKLEEHVNDARKKGGKVLVGGHRLLQLGENFYQPTVITGATLDMAVFSEETFGPLGALFSFETEEEVIRYANDTEAGLADYIFTNDIRRVGRVAEALDVGMVGVNTGLLSDSASPFGGVKESGFGREGSLYGISDYQVIKSVTYGGMDCPLQGT